MYIYFIIIDISDKEGVLFMCKEKKSEIEMLDLFEHLCTVSDSIEEQIKYIFRSIINDDNVSDRFKIICLLIKNLDDYEYLKELIDKTIDVQATKLFNSCLSAKKYELAKYIFDKNNEVTINNLDAIYIAMENGYNSYYDFLPQLIEQYDNIEEIDDDSLVKSIRYLKSFF